VPKLRDSREGLLTAVLTDLDHYILEVIKLVV
jgi:hypothetical protein